ncbi:MAG: hypothetical protein JWM11_4707 [Planctomycetaceae bacterium]|nr:hypothetical protein [Planctomycetaceae bacterium]
MPRKLLRVALVAAIVPALAPESCSAQTIQAGSTVRAAAAQPNKKGVSAWLQKLRGEKPAPNTIKTVKFDGDNPFEDSNMKVDTPFDLEGNDDLRLLKSKQPTRRRPSANAVQEFEPAAEQQQATTPRTASRTAARKPALETPLVEQPAARVPAAELPQAEAVATPVEEEVPAAAASAETQTDNPFPNDPPPRRRGRRTVAPLADLEIPDPPVRSTQASNDFATPVEAVEETPEAFPIETAAPPADVNAGYRATEGTTPRYRRTNMQNSGPVEVPPAPVAADAPDETGSEININRPLPTQPVNKAMTGMRGGPAVVNGPQSGLPVYGQPNGPIAVYSGPAGYARLDSALYPSPRQDIPPYVGSTMITNPAFDPHEMLYAHRYRGLYGPFYHKTYRSWVMTPFGICKSEKRVLVGTEVRVNYRSSISPFALFFPPVTR